MTIIEVLKLVATVELSPMTPSIRMGYDCETESPLYGTDDKIAVVVDGDVLQVEVFSKVPGGDDVYTLRMETIKA